MKRRYDRIAEGVLMLLASAITMACVQTAVEGVESTAGTVPAAQSAGTVNSQGGMSTMFEGRVVDMIDAGRYVYIQVQTVEKKVWVAAPAFDGDIGDGVLVPPGVPVADFQSRKLGRKFDMIYFVGDIRRVGETDGVTAPDVTSQDRMMHPPMDELAEIPAVDIGRVEKADGGYSVSEIIAGRDDLAGREVVLRARAVRFTSNIMGKNWLHVRDGSGDEGANDLVVTTDAVVKAGDLLLIRGVVRVDQDFGFGFKYDVIIENADVAPE